MTINDYIVHGTLVWWSTQKNAINVNVHCTICALLTLVVSGKDEPLTDSEKIISISGSLPDVIIAHSCSPLQSLEEPQDSMDSKAA